MRKKKVTVKIDEDTLAYTKLICNDLGLSLSTAANIFFKAMVRENGFPFKLKADQFYQTENIDFIYQEMKKLDKSNPKTECSNNSD